MVLLASSRKIVAIVGAGPAGLIAAQELSRYNTVDIHIFEQKPSVARKFLIAGRGGLNLTHSEPITTFAEKYDENKGRFTQYLGRFAPKDMLKWAETLGIKTFKGSSGRIFPDGLKATPLLRAWLKALDQENVTFHLKHSWQGTKNDGTLIFQDSEVGQIEFNTDAILYAMGGSSYPHLGSNGKWVDPMQQNGVDITPLAPSNCGFKVSWSPHLLSKHEGSPIKNITLSFNDHCIAGDLVITKTGLEGGALYALSKQLRQSLQRTTSTVIELDLKPEASLDEIGNLLSAPRGKMSLSNFLRKKLRLSPAKLALLYEFTEKPDLQDVAKMSKMIKALPVPLTGINDITRAISSAGGVKFDNLDENLMLKNKPGQFVAGEMLDWEAPTGGYLLQGSFATGVIAADGITSFLKLSQS